MHLLDINCPQKSIYFKASFVIRVLLVNSPIEFFDLFLETKKLEEMTSREFHMSIIWLYLIGVVKMDESFNIHLIPNKKELKK